MNPISICPATATADLVAELEACIDQTEQLIWAASLGEGSASPAMLEKLETLKEELILKTERARNQLAATNAVSPAGAIAQLLAANRDLRINDDLEHRRARQLEARAMEYLERSGLLDGALVRRVASRSGDQGWTPNYPASRAISSSEMS